VPLDLLHPATRAWFEASFAAPSRVQVEGWPRLAAGEHALLAAPTGSGKTLAAFLLAIDRLVRAPAPARPGVRVLYVSPLKALAYDVERNLRVPLAGVMQAGAELGQRVRALSIGVRTGDTPARERARQTREPPELLITTPESLYLLLAAQARAGLASVDTVIVDEIHALAPTKRGAHLALSLERLAALAGRDPQRIGLSATARPLAEVAAFLGGDRPVSVVDASEPPRLDVRIEVPVDEVAPAAVGGAQPEMRQGAWKAIHPRLLELIRGHTSTIVFTNSRRLCERLAQHLNELDGGPTPLVRAHHGSIARAAREEIERELKEGRVRGLVATSSLELGIDMGAVDLVVQIESPGAVSRGLQRIGRAGHQVGAQSVGVVFPKHRADLLEAAVVARGMLDGAVEPLRVPRQPLDVLAQHIVAAAGTAPWPVAALGQMVRRAHNYRDLPESSFVGVLDMLAGKYPSDDFPDLRPRIVWDRATDVIETRRDAKLIAVTSGGTIPDRGLYAVHVGAGGPRIGELDEEMVHESRPGQTFFLGASSWRIQEITRDRVIVTPAPGEPGRLPFWRGEGPGRPLELGRALGRFVRELGERGAGAGPWLQAEYRLDARAAASLIEYVAEQRAAVGDLPSDACLTVERFRDELGDWRVCLLSPFGARVHAPWALALGARLGDRAQVIWSDDGIVVRSAAEAPPAAELLFPAPDELDELLLGELGGSALFATHFRENAARALLLPRRRAGTRTPLWSQRLRAGDLLAVAARHPSFPIVLETYRECLHDVFDVAALRELLGQVARRELRVAIADTAAASPFARSLAFAWVAAFLYEADAPLAERKAQALGLDRRLLAELLGQEELRDLLDAAALDAVEAELQGLAEERRARSADALHDLLRRVGDLSAGEIAARTDGDAGAWLATLRASGRAFPVNVAGRARYAAVEDVARLRDGLGVDPPAGVPPVFLAPAAGALEGLLSRYARTHGPFTTAEVADRFAVAPAVVEAALAALAQAGRVLAGAFRPSGKGDEWCDAEVLRQLRRRTLERLRGQVAPVEDVVFARFLGRWQRAGGGATLAEAIDRLEGLALPFSELERAVLPARVADYRPAALDELGALGELVWLGRGALGDDDGRVVLLRRERAHLLVDPPGADLTLSPVARTLLERLDARGALFFAEMRLEGVLSDDVLAALWELVWAGLCTNDTFGPLRALGQKRAGLAQRAGGRWSSTRALLAHPAGATERLHAQAGLLLERHGVVAREAVAAEDMAGGFAALAPVLRALEEAGRIRRGHFVTGFSGAQYAHPGAVDRLRAARDEAAAAPEVRVYATVDPANPWGALLPWPELPEGAARPRRAPGVRVVLVDGRPVFVVEAAGDKLTYFPGAADAAAVTALRQLAARARHRELRFAQVNGAPALRSPHADALERAGLRVEPGSLVVSAAQ
jgi:ATP-dependent Lhr-like helicase